MQVQQRSCAKVSLTYGSNRVFDFLFLWILPIGLLLLLSSLFFVTNRNVLHRFYYLLFAAPTLLLPPLRHRLPI